MSSQVNIIVLDLNKNEVQLCKHCQDIIFQCSDSVCQLNGCGGFLEKVFGLWEIRIPPKCVLR